MRAVRSISIAAHRQHHSRPTHAFYHSQESRAAAQKKKFKMPSYIVTLNDDATPEQIAAAKHQVCEQGGKIEHEYTIFKGFSVSFPSDAVTTLEATPYVKTVEKDGQVSIQ
ncbi:hypothetical protein CDD80_1499 [Ophiocordyceps camponoti-rufipedis]|uniref:Inhibitor I9 domain-containing protein n=1 Tax=Ophiocordyceps camponoti-rufipedis TaxID=2004952 RepID=A0A2C5Z3T3_9HYPO|nr:hypothetical protein CDD80_1499 [Ophiocordyceps camponoti-rufipedis]